jgi:hypothetical protein
MSVVTNKCKFQIVFYDIFAWTCHALSVLNVTLRRKSSGLVFSVKIYSKCPYETDSYITLSHTFEVWPHCFVNVQWLGLTALYSSFESLTFHHCNPSWWSFSLISDKILPLPYFLWFQVPTGRSCNRIFGCIPHWLQQMASRVPAEILTHVQYKESPYCVGSFPQVVQH